MYDAFILTYDTPDGIVHKKTQDLLLNLKTKGYHNIAVYAIPWVERKNFKSLIPHRHFEPVNVGSRDLCERLGYMYNAISMEDVVAQMNVYSKTHLLIGGAGMLPKELCDTNRVINSHPAYLPYTRGLDSLKWSIYEGKPIGVTSHIISDECDAGFLIKREMVPLYYWDTFHSVARRQYDMEINMLVDALEDVKTADLTRELTTSKSEAHRRMSHKHETRLMKRFRKMIDRIQI